VDPATLRAKHAALSPVLTERSRRVWAATEAQAIGYGGIARVARATGIAASTIQRGLRELASGEALPGTRTRKAGGGRKRAIDLDATLLRDLDALVEPTAPGDPDSPLRWTCLSARTLAVALEGLGHHISHTVVAELLHGLGYSLQGNAKTREGRQHVDRDAQFRYIARRVRAAQRQQQPTISVDTKNVNYRP
jgi:Rhodopirellula transposase DDE domain